MTKIPVMLTIRGEQRYQGQEPEAVELVTEGEMEATSEGWRICYQEIDLSGLQNGSRPIPNDLSGGSPSRFSV